MLTTRSVRDKFQSIKPSTFPCTSDIQSYKIRWRFVLSCPQRMVPLQLISPSPDLTSGCGVDENSSHGPKLSTLAIPEFNWRSPSFIPYAKARKLSSSASSGCYGYLRTEPSARDTSSIRDEAEQHAHISRRFSDEGFIRSNAIGAKLSNTRSCACLIDASCSCPATVLLTAVRSTTLVGHSGQPFDVRNDRQRSPPIRL